MNAMSYKGYLARVEIDAEDNDLLTGRLAGIGDVVGFQAGDVAGLRQAFHEAVDDYLATCEAIGKAPENAMPAVS